jgi:hypothetical protein
MGELREGGVGEQKYDRDKGERRGNSKAQATR